MNRRLAAGLAIAGLGLIWGTAVQAEDMGGWYFGLSGGITTSNVSQDDIDRSFVTFYNGVVLANTGAPADTAAINSKLDDGDKTWSVNIGYRFNRWVAAEVGYIDLGKIDYTNTVQLVQAGTPFNFLSDVRILSHGPFASVIGLFPLGDRFDAHLRGGLYFADTRERSRAVNAADPTDSLSVEAKDSGSEFFGGIGGTWNINPSYSVRVEYQHFLDVGGDRTNSSDYDIVNVSLLFR
jgi:hypothetical protein